MVLNRHNIRCFCASQIQFDITFFSTFVIIKEGGNPRLSRTCWKRKSQTIGKKSPYSSNQAVQKSSLLSVALLRTLTVKTAKIGNWKLRNETRTGAEKKNCQKGRENSEKDQHH